MNPRVTRGQLIEHVVPVNAAFLFHWSKGESEFMAVSVQQTIELTMAITPRIWALSKLLRICT